MAWIEPKTNWEATDYFNAEDYNRMIGNLAYLKEFSRALVKDFEILDMGGEKAYSDFIYAREINVLEDNLETINLKTYAMNIGEKVVYRDNGNTPLYSEFNRMEKAMKKIYEEMSLQKANLSKLAFRLRGQKGIRV